MGILGTDYDSFTDMVDGGGPGQSGNTFDNDNGGLLPFRPQQKPRTMERGHRTT